MANLTSSGFDCKVVFLFIITGESYCFGNVSTLQTGESRYSELLQASKVYLLVISIVYVSKTTDVQTS